MAIAYYIPDQARLLAGRRPNREAVNNQRNTAASNQTPLTNPSSRPTDSQASAPQAAENDRGYGTTINVTVPTATTPAEATGCWDFLAQVFCHALRFYHESSQIQPTVIQISVNFQSLAAEAANSDNNNSTEVATANSTSEEKTATGATTSDNLTPTGETTTTSATENTSSATSNAPKKPSQRSSSRREEKSPKSKSQGKRKN
ncbi:grim [Musca autumnalis]|uniref:grim n=1 Tax=Musca autumnalis TaxID=221902 RepID=UPI003CEA6782